MGEAIQTTANPSQSFTMSPSPPASTCAASPYLPTKAPEL